MPDPQQLLLFIVAGLLLNLTPGPDVLYIVSNALRAGVRAGVVAGLGITAGCFVHVFAAAVGVGALLATSAAAFTVLKWLGAAYLLYVGIGLLLSRAPPAAAAGRGAELQHRGWLHSPPASGNPHRSWAVFRGGFLTNVLNPKVAIFFLAFVPQFIAPDAEHKALAFVLLGALFNVNGMVVNAFWAVAAAWMARRASVQRGLQWLDRAAGAMFIGFGLKLALSDHPTR